MHFTDIFSSPHGHKVYSGWSFSPICWKNNRFPLPKHLYLVLIKIFLYWRGRHFLLHDPESIIFIFCSGILHGVRHCSCGKQNNMRWAICKWSWGKRGTYLPLYPEELGFETRQSFWQMPGCTWPFPSGELGHRLVALLSRLKPLFCSECRTAIKSYR